MMALRFSNLGYSGSYFGTGGALEFPGRGGAAYGRSYNGITVNFSNSTHDSFSSADSFDAGNTDPDYFGSSSYDTFDNSFSNDVCMGSSANLKSGNLYHSQKVSILTFSYNSLDPYNGPLGKGWTHNYNLLIIPQSDGSLVLKRHDGNNVYFRLSNGIYYPDAKSGDTSTIVKNTDGTYTLATKYSTNYTFNTSGKLVTIQTSNGKTITLNYSGSDLAGITDSTGRTIRITTNNGKIISITDFIGRTYSLTYTGDILSTIANLAGKTWQYTYDTNGRMLTKTDPIGNTTSYTYDSNGMLLTSTDPEGKIKSIAYDKANNTARVTRKDGSVWIHKYDSNLNAPLEITDPQGNTIRYTYDSNRNLTAKTRPDGSTITFTYDAKSNITSITDPLGNTATYTYNGLSRVTGITDPQGNKTAFVYDAKGNLADLTDPNGATVQYQYDSKGNIVGITDPDNRKAQFTYDQYNHLSSIADPSGATTKFAYDLSRNIVSLTDDLGDSISLTYNSLNQLVKVTDPLENVTTYAYDEKGNRTSVTDANGNVTSFEYNLTGQVTKVKDALGNITTFTYGGTGCSSCGGGTDKLTAVTDAKGNATTYQYDILGRPISKTDPLGNITSYTYDAKGNLTAKTDANGNTISYAYDALNRLTQKTYPDGNRTVFQYDSKGNMIYAGNKDIAYNFSYDARGSLTEIIDSNSRAISYQYDATGKRTQMITPEGKTITYAYDANSRLTQLLSEMGTFDFTYDTLGRRTKLSMPNGASTTYSYDADSRLTALLHKTSRGAVIDSFTYTHDNVGNRLTKTEVEKKYTYSYDAVYRLLQSLPSKYENRDGHGEREHEYKQEHGAEAFSYDPVGNRLTGPERRDPYVYNQGNQLNSDRKYAYEYDRNGSLIKKTEIGDDDKPKVFTYSYDYENRLIKVEIQNEDNLKVITFAYDPFGRRIAKTVQGKEIEDQHEGERDGDDHESLRTTYYVYDNTNILLEYNQRGGVTARYLHGIGIDGHLAVQKRERTYYYHADGLGSIVALTDKWSRVVQRYDYDSFGNMKHHGYRIKQPYTYTGREWDQEVGLYFYRARYYDARAGRFITKDPIGFAGGDVNLYAYVGNNPATWVDPYGLLGLGDIWSGISNGLKPVGTGTMVGAIIGGGLGTATGVPGAGLALGALGGWVGSLFDPPGAGQLNYKEPSYPVIRPLYTEPVIKQGSCN